MKNYENYVLKNVNLIDGYGGDVQKNMYIEVEGKTISAVGSMDDYKAPERAAELDFTDHYVMPGLIDAHLHLSGGRGEGTYLDGDIISEPNVMRAMRSVGDARQLLKRVITSKNQLRN